MQQTICKMRTIYFTLPFDMLSTQSKNSATQAALAMV